MTDDDDFHKFDLKLETHNEAFANPRPGFEQAIADLISGFITYRVAYVDRYHVELSNDPHVSNDWLTVARGIVGLLDGDTERFHCPTLDGLIRATAQQAGLSLTLEKKPG